MSAVNERRVPPLQGGRNFRDLGGYAAADGRRVKWGVIFRSGSLAGLTQADWDTLTARRVRAVCDLRTTREREAEPFAWKDAGLEYFARDYATSFGELRKVLATNLATEAAARAAMVSGYRELPFEQSQAYGQIFLHLRRNDVPLIFNCSAGKDRAGTAAALVLGALGVKRDAIIEDFVLTNQVLDLRKALTSSVGDASLMSGRPTAVVTAILDADAQYIEAALDSVEEKHGSIEGYLRDVLSVDDRDLVSIRGNLLE